MYYNQLKVCVIRVAQSFLDQFNRCFRKKLYIQCPNCHNFSMADDICYVCAYQYSFTQRIPKALTLLPQYFSDGQSQGLQTQNSCSIGVYLQRVNRIHVPWTKIFSVLYPQMRVQQTDEPLRPDPIRLRPEQHKIR